MSEEINIEDVQEPINDSSPQVKEVIQRVLRLEKDKIYHKNLRNINEYILKIIKEVVQ